MKKAPGISSVTVRKAHGASFTVTASLLDRKRRVATGGDRSLRRDGRKYEEQTCGLLLPLR